MAESIVPFNAMKQTAKVLEGYKGGPFYRKPNLAPSITFEEGHPASISQMLEAKAAPQSTPIDPWVNRRK